MNVAVFTPTKRAGGIDVIEASLERQTYKDFDYFVCDELERDFWWEWSFDKTGVEGTLTLLKPPFTRYVRNLASAYNLMAEYATEGEYDLLISLQDYLWLPPDGIERFVNNYGSNGDQYIYTGLTSISGDPSVSEVWDANAPYSIFNTPYRDEPLSVKWKDVRATTFYNSYFDDGKYIITINDPNHFEMNWAAIPVMLFHEGLKWDTDYDKGVACENNQFALDAITMYDCGIIIDSQNHAISLPHRDYFNEGEIGSEANKRNLDKFAQNLNQAKGLL